jgi:restriction endonuclease S subunit
MKEGWQTSSLGDVLAVLRNGVNCKQDKSGIGEKITRIESISDAKFDPSKVGYAQLSERDKGQNRLERGDILFSHINSAAHVGKTAMFDCSETVYHGVNLLLIRPKQDLFPGYLNYALKQLFYSGYWRRACKQSVNQASVNQQDISRVEIHFPVALAEQERLVALLDEAFEALATAKANAEQSLQSARALFESHLETVITEQGVDWVDSTIGEEINFIDYRGKTPVKTSRGVRLITAKNVKKGFLLDAPNEFIAADNYESWMTRGVPKKGDVLFTTEAPLANVAQLDTDERVAFAQRIIVMQPNPARLDSTFLKYLLLSRPVQRRIRERGTGATVQGIKASLLKLIRISFPSSLAIQKVIVGKLDSLSLETQCLTSIYERKLAALEELKTSLLHQAFNGEL